MKIIYKILLHYNKLHKINIIEEQLIEYISKKMTSTKNNQKERKTLYKKILYKCLKV